MSILDGAAARLYWEPGRGGCATRKGRRVPLAEPPDLGSGRVYAIDYVPASIHVVRRAVHDAPALMEPWEIAAAEAVLRAFVPTAPGGL